jgi:hypothetical protein
LIVSRAELGGGAARYRLGWTSAQLHVAIEIRLDVGGVRLTIERGDFQIHVPAIYAMVGEWGRWLFRSGVAMYVSAREGFNSGMEGLKLTCTWVLRPWWLAAV